MEPKPGQASLWPEAETYTAELAGVTVRRLTPDKRYFAKDQWQVSYAERSWVCTTPELAGFVRDLQDLLHRFDYNEG